MSKPRKHAPRRPVGELVAPEEEINPTVKLAKADGQLTLQDLHQTSAEKAQFARDQANAVQFHFEKRPLSPAFCETCYRVGKELGMSKGEIDDRLAPFRHVPFIRKSFPMGFLCEPTWYPEADPTAEKCIKVAMEQFEAELRAQIKKKQLLVEKFNKSVERSHVPPIAPPKKRRKPRPEGQDAHTTIRRKLEWSALHFIFNWTVASIQKSIKWNPSPHTRQAIESVLREFGADLGLTNSDFRTQEERKRAAAFKVV